MNTGTVMAGSRLSKEQRYDWLRKFGIGEKTEVGLPAEATGILAKPEQWDDRQQYTVLFGQGVSQSTLQTVRAYQSIANDGVMLQPRLIDSYIDPDGVEQKVPAKDPRQVVSKETAQQVRDILESAVTEGRSRTPRSTATGWGRRRERPRLPVKTGSLVLTATRHRWSEWHPWTIPGSLWKSSCSARREASTASPTVPCSGP